MERHDLKSFTRLALATTAATYLLILVGALVRAAGAGLGCPDWPRCYGQWIPPVSVSQLPPGFDPETFNALLTWTEYLNRLLGITVGFLIIATVVVALRRARFSRAITGSSIAALLMVGFEGWLGGQVVRSGLEPWMISAHLLGALVTVILLLYATFTAWRLESGNLRIASGIRRRLSHLTAAVIGLLLCQIWLGTLVRGGIQHAVELDPELPRAAWLNATHAAFLDHRSLSALVILAVVALGIYAQRQFPGDRRLRRWATIVVMLSGTQILLGISLERLALPAVSQVLHLSVASLMLGALVVMWLLARQEPTNN